MLYSYVWMELNLFTFYVNKIELRRYLTNDNLLEVPKNLNALKKEMNALIWYIYICNKELCEKGVYPPFCTGWMKNLIPIINNTFLIIDLEVRDIHIFNFYI